MGGPDGGPPRTDWDRLRERLEDDAPAQLLAEPVAPADIPPATAADDRPVPALQLVAAAWGDLVAVLAVCTAALLAVVLTGHPVGWRALPWAAGLAGLWWLATAAATVLVRHATPGMLVAGVRFTALVAPRRVPWVVLVAAIQMLLVGLPATLPVTPPLLARVAGQPLRASVE